MTRITLQILDLGSENKERYHATQDAVVSRADIDSMSDEDLLNKHLGPLVQLARDEFAKQAKVYEKKHPSAEKSS